MNEFESDWISLSQSHSGERECFGVNLREENKVSESKMAEYKKAAIIKFSQNEWVKGFFMCKMAESRMAEFKLAAIIKLSQNEQVKVILCKMSESKMAEFKMAAIIKFSQNEWVKFFYVQIGQIKDGRIQDSCNHQVESEWMSEVFLCKWWELILAGVSEFERQKLRWLSLSQIELVWVRVRVERECFWVNLREDNKVPESNMAVSESNMAEFRMAATIKLSQNEWVKFLLCKWWEPILASVSEFER